MARASRSSRSSRRSRPDVEALLRRRRNRRVFIGVLAALVLVALVVADHQHWLLYAGDDMARYDGRRFEVTRVIDGDTLEVAAPDGDRPVTRVRLWGIDTPELGYDGDPDAPGAAEARRFAHAQATGKTVRLVLEPHRPRGNYHRVLAFVHLPDEMMLNEALLAAGWAEADDRWPHRHLARFEALEREARDAGRGIWAER